MELTSTDAELVIASQAGSHAAFRQLVERYQPLVSAVSYSRAGNRALGEEVAQDTFLVAWQQLHQLRDGSKLRPWLCQIACHAAHKAKRRSSKEIAGPVPDGDALSTPFDVLAEAQADRRISDALARVPARYRDVLVLYYRCERSVRDVASQLGLSEAATLQRLVRGRRCLARNMELVVGTALASQRPRRNFAAGVMALLPTARAPRIHAGATARRFAWGLVGAAGAATTVVGTGPLIVVAHAEPQRPAVVAPAARAGDASYAVDLPTSHGDRRSQPVRTGDSRARGSASSRPNASCAASSQLATLYFHDAHCPTCTLRELVTQYATRSHTDESLRSPDAMQVLHWMFAGRETAANALLDVAVDLGLDSPAVRDALASSPSGCSSSLRFIINGHEATFEEASATFDAIDERTSTKAGDAGQR
jgi:RNA polymerase sigma-70 factor (ECF subfamily)